MKPTLFILVSGLWKTDLYKSAKSTQDSDHERTAPRDGQEPGRYVAHTGLELSQFNSVLLETTTSESTKPSPFVKKRVWPIFVVVASRSTYARW